ncbi:MAG: hypothetical protein A3H64_03910 [Candidatus Ryanbacteria bacterium RIFCSPLOWO2_02_FULL_45_11c]|uniref:Inhibitor I9 domain-containing protein n=1 Tax=Candidatus Ryanbacteria bacterium RIFCSPLOWO2_02_FULL_45_11c TaxID=1802128 RepID=A0A1G2GUW9_9BACT|nr:MAG: hypothetical protein A3H64_03910 [Candidatus Ryanbacteria bacterium RIFCSPLOWO2_02_FULL_45_11c]
MQKGFGLIRILIVIGIIAGIGALVFKSVSLDKNPFMSSAEEKSAIDMAEQMKDVVEKKNNETMQTDDVANENIGSTDLTDLVDRVTEKLHPRLREIIDQESPDDYVEVVINLQESASREDIIKSFQSYDVTVMEQYFIINGFLARVSVKNIERIAIHPDVISVSPRFGGEPPPSN